MSPLLYKYFRIVSSILFFSYAGPSFAQIILPISNEITKRVEYNQIVDDTVFYSHLKPYLSNRVQDFSQEFGIKSEQHKSWLWRKVFKESLVKVDSVDYYLYVDPLFDFHMGRDNTGNLRMINTRGFRAGGILGKKVAFGTEFYENQAKFTPWVYAKIIRNFVVPGHGKGRVSNEIWDFAVASGYLSYQPVKNLNFSIGQGKNFIGDGNRSLILSDVTYTYPFVRSEWTNKRFHYFWIIALLQDPKIKVSDRVNPYLRKIFNTRGLTVNLANKLYTTILYSEIFNNPDTNRIMKHEPAVYNPILIPLPSKTSRQALWGINLKYSIGNLWLYNQWTFDNLFESADVSIGSQVGFKYFNAFSLKGLYVQMEYNRIEPDTYEDDENLRLNWLHFLEPLAHPLGNNFEEINSRVLYDFRRWQINIETNFSKSLKKTSNMTSSVKQNFPSVKSNEKQSFIKSEISYFLNPVTLSCFSLGYQQFQNNLSFPGKNNYIYFSFSTKLSNRYFDY